MTIQLSIELNQLALLTAGAVRCVSVDSIEQRADVLIAVAPLS